MASKWNWRKLGYGSGAAVAAISTVFALKSTDRDKAACDNDELKPSNKLQLTKSKVLTTPSPETTVHNFINASNRAHREENLNVAIQESRKLCKRLKNQLGLPGLTVGVSVNGKMMWQEGFGFANIENNVKMQPEQVMRIASISKSMTMAMMGQLMEQGKIDIDKPIQTYLPSYPEKVFDGEKVTITTRHLLSHLSGIRHYIKKEDELDEKSPNKCSKCKAQEEMEIVGEFFLKDNFSSVEDSMKLFQNDELYHKPGTKYFYTTHGWTVVSAVIEKLTETSFPKHAKKMFDMWGLENTYLDQHEPIIYNRASYYTRRNYGEIINAPYVDNSYKWAGGGFLSNVADLSQFANILLYSMQTPEGSPTFCAKGLPKTPYLKQSTMQTMWTGNPATARPPSDNLYGLGFVVGEPLRKCMFCKERDIMTVNHSGGAMGASSILLLAFPKNKLNTCDSEKSSETTEVKGVVVAMITNLSAVSLSKTAQEIANNFRILI
ncbi:Serine beta-lactamase-like protein LACTB, mitochondrial [Orchesella cincta]|uniref:Serine beta-lactamase-like protein LACTB, mitochondrial n=1 Tax=Orchesella cincta TaxID=48709 RepID=A0A1D2MQ68_ORCCI|nr:Serine beta-lactamase-like protein LACTB, mitochondrial [Orchesella cincta]